MAKLTKANLSLLAVIVAAMSNDAAPFHMATKTEVKNLLNNDLVEVNEEIVDGDKVAVRATEKGVAEAASATEGTENLTDTATATPAASTGGFEIETGIEKPAGRRARTASTYPFDDMPVGSSFHIPATANKPDPAKSMASTVSSANKRFSTETGETESFTRKVYQLDAAGKRVKGEDGKLVSTGTETITRPVLKAGKTFSVKAVGSDDPKGAGARVWRDA